MWYYYVLQKLPWQQHDHAENEGECHSILEIGEPRLSGSSIFKWM